MQNQIPFPDGSAVRLTVARYYTPTGRSIQKPYSNGREDYYNELLSRYQHDEMFSADSIHFADSLKYTTESDAWCMAEAGSCRIFSFRSIRRI